VGERGIADGLAIGLESQNPVFQHLQTLAGMLHCPEIHPAGVQTFLNRFEKAQCSCSQPFDRIAVHASMKIILGGACQSSLSS
jgi:hypothetical protein